jgi:hypothetical protein
MYGQIKSVLNERGSEIPG